MVDLRRLHDFIPELCKVDNLLVVSSFELLKKCVRDPLGVPEDPPVGHEDPPVAPEESNSGSDNVFDCDGDPFDPPSPGSPSNL